MVALKKMQYIIGWAALVLPFFALAQQVHDPVIIRQDSTYYVFATGNGIAVWSSNNKQDWKKEAPVFAAVPEWTKAAIPSFKGHFWAPDIALYKGKYYLFYAVSSFGFNTSCIGVAVNETLHPNAPNFAWKDMGKVIASVHGQDRWNAIDPNLIVDDTKTPWLSFGSFWEGIKLVQLKPDLSEPVEPQQLFSIARRNKNAALGDTLSGGGAIEAPFIFKKGAYYYLFVSFDLCCRGLKSTYKILVGRSKNISGPYMDKQHVPMTQGGGSLVLAGNDVLWSAVGHNAVASFDGIDYLVFHAYDATNNGKPKLRIEPLQWDENGWPEVGGGRK